MVNETISNYFIENHSAPFQKNELNQLPKVLVVLTRLYFGTIGRLIPKLSAKLAMRIFSAPGPKAVHKRSDTLLDSAQRLFIQVNGQQIRVYVWGDGPRKTLLLHGWQSRGTALRGFVPGLLDQGRQVIAFDAPAHGESSGGECSVRLYAEVIDVIEKKYPGIDTVIAHSIGNAAWIYYNSMLNPNKQIKQMVGIAAPESFKNILYNAIALMGLKGKVKALFKQECFNHFKVESIEELELSQLIPAFEIDQVDFFHDEDDNLVSLDRAIQVQNAFSSSSLLVTKGFGHFRLVKHPKLVQKVVSLCN